MTERRRVAGSPLFLRVFLLMVVCVGVTQLLNVALLVAVQSPSARIVTIAQIAEALRGNVDPGEDFSVSYGAALPAKPWNPRVERLGQALRVAMGAPADRVALDFPLPFLQRPKTFDREQFPHPTPPPNARAAGEMLVAGDFVAAFRRDDGVWVRVSSGTGFEPWRWFVLYWLLLSAIAVAPFAWALAHRLAKPIGAFAAAAERLGRDPRAPPLPIQGPPEIAEAAAAFNQMQARLNRYVDDRTTVVGAVAHDLRTPLMRLGLRLESAPDAMRQACENDIRDMEAMISASLNYLRDANSQSARRPLDLRSLAESVVDDLSDRGERVTLEPGEPVVIDGNSAALKALLSNLIGNAVKYAGNADVTLGTHEGNALIEVCDDGPGVPPEDIERVFEPFFRGERSRNRDTGGIGLGLASARAVARAHGGDVVLRNREQGGACALVTLPI